MKRVLHFGQPDVPKCRTLFILKTGLLLFTTLLGTRCAKVQNYQQIHPFWGRLKRLLPYLYPARLEHARGRRRRGVTARRTNPDNRARFPDDARSKANSLKLIG